MKALAALLFLMAGCSLDERSDFLVGRDCDPHDGKSCDQGEACLPHTLMNGVAGDFRCRDRASFETINGREAPLAFCDPAMGFVCPGDLVCNADRVRADAAVRLLVCKRPDDIFSPPLADAGPNGGG